MRCIWGTGGQNRINRVRSTAVSFVEVYAKRYANRTRCTNGSFRSSRSLSCAVESALPPVDAEHLILTHETLSSASHKSSVNNSDIRPMVGSNFAEQEELTTRRNGMQHEPQLMIPVRSDLPSSSVEEILSTWPIPALREQINECIRGIAIDETYAARAKANFIDSGNMSSCLCSLPRSDSAFFVPL